MKPRNFSPPHRIEHDYATSIQALLSKYLDYDQPPQSVIEALSNLASSPAVLEDIATRLAQRMVTQVRVINARSWRAAARESSKGRIIYEALHREMQGGVGVRVNQIVKENSRLIGSIPSDVRSMVSNEIAGWQREGLRPEAIAQKLRARIPQLTRNKAKLIARTETSKAATALTKARAEEIGIGWGQWATSEDQRVRPSHRNLDKVLIAITDPPQPEQLIHEHSTLGRGLPGEFPNCRCIFLPLVSLDQVSWPCRVFTSNSIRRMTRGQFAEFSGMRRQHAA